MCMCVCVCVLKKGPSHVNLDIRTVHIALVNVLLLLLSHKYSNSCISGFGEQTLYTPRCELKDLRNIVI